MIRVALVPAKPVHRAKERLRLVLGARARARLSGAMLRDVLGCLDHSALFVSVSVVTRDRRLQRRVRRWGFHTLAPPPRVRGLNAELRWAAAQPLVAQADRLLVIPGDVPGVSVTDLFRLVLPPLARGVRLTPSTDGGTNALVLAPPAVIPFRFGPNSAARHQAAAGARAASVDVLALPSLRADIDLPSDLLAAAGQAGPRTRRALAAINGGHLQYRKRPKRRQSKR